MHSIELELLELDVGPEIEAAPPTEPTRRSRRERAPVAIALALAVAALGVALIRPGPVTAPEPVPAAVPAFAEMYVAAYLTASGPEGLVALRSFYPAVPEIAFAAADSRFVTQVVTTAASPAGPGAWRVETAATVLVGDGAGYVSDGTHHYSVAVVATDTGLAAVALPSRIGAPPEPAVPATVDADPVDDESLRRAVDAFLAAYLLGGGDIDHLVAPGSGIAAVTPPPYRALTVDAVTASASPGGGAHVRVTGTATPHRGSPLPVELHLTLSPQAGVWKVTALSPGPMLRGP